MTAKKNKNIPDADFSSAGDDFHVLWTIKKSLELLNFNDSGIKAVYIERVDKKSSKSVDPHENKLLGVDLSEYYGGANFETAEKIIISQLKYSTVRVSKNFTFAELYKGKSSKNSNKYSGSIIYRFGEIFKSFLDEFGRESILHKVTIKLISNRSFSDRHLKTINKIQNYLLKNKRVLSFNEVQKKITDHKDLLKNLQKASSLNLTEFTDFLRILDFSECGVKSRRYIEIELVKAISNTTVTSRNQYNSLHQMVWNKMMPESKFNRGISSIDVIAELGGGDGSIEYLFPIKNSFNKNNNLVKRRQLTSILEKLLKNDLTPICIHGGAGIGKSTIVKQISKNLSKYDKCILFDCYGSGAYRNSDDNRHKHKNALQHLSNELAQKIGSDFLIINGESNDVYIKEFKKRVEQAITILKTRNQEAKLTIIIDAADNSITAAENNGEKSFVEDILNIQIPSGLNLIVTSRTHRKGSLNLPDKYLDIQLEPFHLEETKEFLLLSYPNANIEEIEDFHKYTNGIPRAQFYSLDLKKQGISETINFLKPNGKTVEDIILGKIEEAKKKVSSSDKKLIDVFLELLIILPRPVPVDYLLKSLNCEKDFLEDISTEIWTGLVYKNNFFEFRDEDFENYIRETYPINPVKLDLIANLLLENSDNDEYASINLGNALLAANEHESLKKIVLKRDYLNLPKDPIRNREVYINRAKLAIKACKSSDDNLTLFKLIFIIAEESKKDKALVDLITEYPDLVAEYGDESSLNKFILNSENKDWAGSFHMKLAGLYSRQPSTIKKALKHQKTANDWLNWFSNNSKRDESYDINISNRDISNYTEAVLRLYGSNEAYESLNSWKPKSIIRPVGDFLINSVLEKATQQEINEWITPLKVNIDTKIFIICRLCKYQKTYHYNIKEIAERLIQIIKKGIKINFQFKQLIIDFCEILIYKEKENLLALSILILIKQRSLSPNVPLNLKTREKEENNIDIYLKLKTLISSLNQNSVSIDLITPKSLKDLGDITDYEKKSSLERSKKEFVGFFKHLLPIHQLYSHTLSNYYTLEQSINEFKKICKNFNDDYLFAYENGYWAKDKSNYFVQKLLKTVMLIGDTNLINILIDSFVINSNKLDLLFSVIKSTKHLDAFLLDNIKLTNEIDLLIKQNEFAANETIKKYIECSLISFSFEKSTSKYFFEEAINALDDVDYEALQKIRCISSLSQIGIREQDSKLAYEYARFVEYSDIKLTGYDKDHFPYKETLLGISNIDLPSMYSTLCRWHHRGVVNIEEYIIPVLVESLKKGYVSHKIAGALIPLRGHSNYSDDFVELINLILEKFDKERDLETKTKFVQLIFRDLKLSQDRSIIVKVYKKIESGAFIKKEVLKEIKIYLAFLAGLENDENKEVYSYPKIEANHNLDLSKIDFCSTYSLEKAIREIKSNAESFNDKFIIDEFFKEITQSCLPNQYIKHLNAFVDIDGEFINFSSFEIALKERLEKWSVFAPLKQWKKEKFKYVLLIWFSNFDYGNTLAIGRIYEFAEIFDIDKYQLIETLIDIIPEKIETLSDESIYTLFELIKDRLTIKDNTEIINWTLSRWNKKIKSSVADGPWELDLTPPRNSDEVISTLLRFILGNPDKTLRWQAIHSIRRLANLGNLKVLEKLLEKQNEINCFPFQNKEYLFYWMSSKLYLWVSIERVSLEEPEKLLCFKNLLLKEINDQNLPHALIKFYAKKTCINLLQFKTSVFSPEQVGVINSLLVSTFEKSSTHSSSRSEKTLRGSTNNWNFNFDTLDTLPYWYNTLGRIFGLTEYHIADIADKFITENWGYTSDPNDDNYTSNHKWELTSHRQGSNPQVEKLRTYFEYHAMFCTASYLLDREALLVVDFEDEYNSFEPWIESEALTHREFWLSDLRDPLPLRLKFWKNEYTSFDEKWRDSIDEKKFDEEIGLNNLQQSQFIIPYASYERYIGENTESVTIRSALVSKKGSESLLRALQSTKNSDDYLLPMQDLDRDMSICENGFSLQGWLSVIESDYYEGLDKYDYLNKGIDKERIIIYNELTKDQELIFSSDFKQILDKKGSLISNYTMWNEITDRKYRHLDNIESGGNILEVNLEFIQKLLAQENQNLIIECRVNKQLKSRRYRSDDRSQPWEHIKIYLLEANGTITTKRGSNFRVGKKDS